MNILDIKNNNPYNTQKRRVIDQHFFYKNRIRSKNRLYKNLKNIKSYLKLITTTLINYFDNRKLCQQINTYCMFIGPGKSGTTLIGMLLDAHPNIAISNESDALRHIYWGMKKNLLFSLILEKSKKNIYFIKSKKNIFHVPKEWQGKFRLLKVVGDKNGERSTKLLKKHPKLFYKLKKNVGVNTKFILIIRNPYDVITTRAIRRQERLNYVIKEYFSIMETVQKLRKQIPSEDIFELKHEHFIDNPKLHLKRLCEFLGQKAEEQYLNNCESTVHIPSHQSRYDIKWPNKEIKFVKNKISQFDILQKYSYEE